MFSAENVTKSTLQKSLYVPLVEHQATIKNECKYHLRKEVLIMSNKVEKFMMDLYIKCQALKNNTVEALSNKKGDAYIDTVIKILIAVVVGALLLWALYKLMGDTVVPELTSKISEIFDKTPTA